ncbi:putative arabinosyltransferase [Gordonia effusa NBRC 100432]|uniref:Putative arabinosyltransferase n=1 Tax=Gordonia effusa NBRC 100432 TaxID=1077974 RepID=H0R585_9ACTN|nr:arabinosyltransferase domain-containing protein [Gordonia effusa]GAB20236.1 putative arabinosyltransferase [Gordonia effusa NBRC 100432]
MPDSQTTPQAQGTGRGKNPAALVAVVAGLVAVLAAILTPFLPVNERTATIEWPAGQQLSEQTASVTAPLVAQTARDLDVTIGCKVLAGVDSRRDAGSSITVLSTMPSSGLKARQSALFVTDNGTTVDVAFRGKVIASAPRADLARCSELHIWSSSAATGAHFVGLGPAVSTEAENRPQVAGIFTDLPTSVVQAATPSQLRVHIDVDNRFDSSPSLIKLLVMVVGVIAAIISLIAVGRLDVLRGYHRRVGKLDLRRLLWPRAVDLVVTAVLLVWFWIAAASPDDGYILNMGRNADGAGYLANYYRFFGVPEAPFDWYYSFLEHWASISTSGLWMRLPALVAGLLSWFILTRVLLPRLGGAVRRSQWAMFTAAAVFCAFWLPLCSGLRSEGIIVLGSLLIWWGVEQAIATRRLLPAALAALSAGLTLALAPHGIIAVALLLAGSRLMLRAVRIRRREDGIAALLMPIAAAASVVIIVVFRDQTLATVAETLRVRYTVGPSLVWYQELLRYYFLVVSTDDGALARRIPVLLVMVSLALCLAIMLRRKKIQGVDPGPVWRVVSAILLTTLLLSFTPTKWTIQFGIYAGVGAALAAVAAVAVAESSRRSPRNFAAFVAALMLACAIATAGKNAWPWGVNLGISWFDKAPSLAGIPLSSVFLGFTGLAVAAAMVLHLRADAVGAPDPDAPVPAWRVALVSSPLVLIAAAMVLVEVALFAKAIAARTDTYTTFAGNVDTVTGKSCGMADYVLVERDANVGMLKPVGGKDLSAALAGESNGFDPNGVGPDLLSEATSLSPGTMNTSGNLARPFVVSGGSPGTTGGQGPRGINGSTAALPFGLNPATTPVLGSYGHNNAEATLTSDWYQLPGRSAGPLIVISAAGPIFSVDRDGATTTGRSLQIEFGRESGGQFTPVGAPAIPIDPGPGQPNRPWRNLRVPTANIPAGATAMRIVARDNSLSPDQWLAVTPPRVPRLQTLQEVVGSTDPVLVDFAVGAQFPCQHPMTASDGVNQIPRWRILPDPTTANAQSKTWQATVNGGILATSEALTRASTTATYLSNDWYREWGNLQQLTPLVPDAPAATVGTGTASRWGWQRTGAIRVVPQDD